MTTFHSRLRKGIYGGLLLAVFPLAWILFNFPASKGMTVCFFRTATGYDCPFCGLTRAFACAMHGQFAQAFKYHPLWWLAFIGIGAGGLVALTDAIKGSDYFGIALRWAWKYKRTLLVVCLFWFIVFLSRRW